MTLRILRSSVHLIHVESEKQQREVEELR